MKIACTQADLSHGLAIVGHAISGRSTLPILANLLLMTDQGRLKLSATNLEIGINYWMEANVQEEGSTTIPAKVLSDLVSSQPRERLELHTDAQQVTRLTSPRSRASIKGMDPSEFPLIPTAEGGLPPVMLEASLLKELIEQVTFAAADDDSRPVLTGTYVEVSQEKLTVAAADAFRLAVRVASLPGETSPRSPILIPARTLNALARILPEEGSVQMIVTPNRSQVLFHTEQIDLVSRLIEGTFPNFRGIIPHDYTTRAVLTTKEFLAAVKSVAPFARDSSNITLVKVRGGTSEAEPGTVTIEATAEDVGSNVSTLTAAVEGPEQEIIFNVKYLSEVLAAMDTPEVALEVLSKARPGVLKPVSAADYTCVIMPMSTNR